jgi:hypothetical protein
MADLEFFTSEVRFKVNGKSYVGVMTAKAWGRLQELWGIPKLADLQKRLGEIELKDTPAIVFASLLKHHPKITEREAEDLADSMGMTGMVQYIGALVKAGSPPATAVTGGPTRRGQKPRKPR